VSGLVERVRLTQRLPEAKAIREGAGVSQAAIAAELRVNRVTVARWENGDRRPSGDLLRRYVALLDALANVTKGSQRAAS
jgi:DNA-binding transcriptional regulator YiaG